ncbi:MAG: polysaccharide biosynthesis/export family protein [Syntrophales bacterium]|jgi:polysaccharide export outer membrane protein
MTICNTQKIIVGLIFILMILPSSAYPQQNKDAASPQKTQAASPQKTEAMPPQKTQGQIATDSNDYIIGPEDVLYIHIWKEESMTKTVPVRMDGKISLPLVDDVQAADLTPLQLKVVLTNKLKNVIDNPTVSVTVMEANSFKVYVSGEVKTPGVLRLRSETSFLQLMTMVGGFTDWADKKKIVIVRKEKGAEKRIKVNYKKILDGGEPDIIINRGDMVIVP